MSPYQELPAIRSSCLARLEASHRASDAEAAELRARLENAAHALRALGPETWGQAEGEIRDIAGRFATHSEYPALGLTRQE